MEHHTAVETHAIERYLLGEMPPEERDDFEEHYFACADCAQDVRAAARFRANTREVLRDPERFSPPEKERRRGFSWWSFPQLVPLSACVLLAGVVVYLAGFQIPELKRQAGAVDSAEGFVTYTIHGATRSAEDTPGAGATKVPPGGQQFSVYFDLASPGIGAPYNCTVRDVAGRTVAALVIPITKGASSVALRLNRSHFPAGLYAVTIQPVGAADPGDTAYKFVVE